MTKKKYDEFMKKVMSGKKISDKENDKNEKAMAKKWQDAEDRNDDELIKELRSTK